MAPPPPHTHTKSNTAKNDPPPKDGNPPPPPGQIPVEAFSFPKLRLRAVTNVILKEERCNRLKYMCDRPSNHQQSHQSTNQHTKHYQLFCFLGTLNFILTAVGSVLGIVLCIGFILGVRRYVAHVQHKLDQ